MNLNGAEYYYVRNVQGDTIKLIDKNGTQVVSYSYDTWGKHDGKAELKDENGNIVQQGDIKGTLASTAGVKNPYRYRGYRYDTETGLYYLQSRYYNPEWGRFINADGLSGNMGELLSHNLFAYCSNNPVNMEDSSGTSWSSSILYNTRSFFAAIAITIITFVVIITSPVLITPVHHSTNYTKSKSSESSKSTPKAKSGSKSKAFPKNPKELDNILGKEGKKVNDGPTTPGRNKIKWKLPNDVTVTHEQHPYDTNAPEFHKGPHYHVDGPGYDHKRFMPGDPLPNIFNPK